MTDSPAYAQALLHDLANWLTAAINSAELLDRLPLPGRGREIVGDLQGILIRCNELLHELRSARELELEPLELGALVSSLAPMLRFICGRHVDVVLATDNGAWISGDRGRLERAIVNLVFNAWEAMPEGGTCRVCVATRDDRVTLLVSDDGVGISESDLPNVFEPWFSTAAKRGRRRGGLGLAVVRAVAEEHEGEASVVSSVGGGTTVKLRFPRIGL